jgi:hypothetical protein
LRVIRLRVGDGLGTRDMVVTQTAMLLLIGPDDAERLGRPPVVVNG